MEFVHGSTLTRFGFKGTNFCGPGFTNGRLGNEPVDDSFGALGRVD